MGTDLSHTPVVGGEEGYPDMVARPDLTTLRELPWEPDVAACLADLERDGAPEPTDLRGLVRRATDELAELGLDLQGRPRARVLPARARRRGRLATPRRHPEHGLHGRPAGRPAGRGQGAARGLRRARPRRDRLQPRVHEQPVRDQPARGRARSTPPTAPSASRRPSRTTPPSAASSRPSWASRSTTRAARARTCTSRSSARARTAPATPTTPPGSRPRCATSSAGCSSTRRR